MTEDQSVQMSMWFAKKAKFQYNCYAWCTENGKIPELRKENVFSGSVIKDLVSNMWHKIKNIKYYTLEFYSFI